MQFSNVSAEAKANIYFDGKVVSHSIKLEDGSPKTFGIIYPGSYHLIQILQSGWKLPMAPAL